MIIRDTHQVANYGTQKGQQIYCSKVSINLMLSKNNCSKFSALLHPPSSGRFKIFRFSACLWEELEAID
jgi:hypothetical protein